MNYVVRSLRSGLNRRQIGDAFRAKLDLLPHAREIFLFPRGKIIEDHHFVPTPNELVHDIRAYESGTTRHQVAQFEPPRERPLPQRSDPSNHRQN
jgi:hypothetical protein